MTELNAEDDSQIQNRFEIIFLYDVEEGNPNGDPLNENRPRVDEQTGENIVTDVRLKRTVRDYLDSQDEGVFIKASENEDGTLLSRQEMVEKALDKDIGDSDKIEIREELLNQFLDVRLFGATISVEDYSFAMTGPVQFKMGRSMHEVDTRYTQQSVSIPSEEGKEQGTFADRYDLPYSLINFYGIVNENAAEDTNLTRGDVSKLADGLWNGTKSLITHSKMAHKPQALLIVEYSEDNYHIGGLDHLIEAESDKEDTEIRRFDQIDLNYSDLREKLEEKADKVEKVYVQSEEDIDLGNLEVEELELE
ncbi:MAG: type I-B CRISPR-associated protein Cas7/Csh2 [Candidatus Nanohaloarchaea archaeon]